MKGRKEKGKKSNRVRKAVFNVLLNTGGRDTGGRDTGGRYTGGSVICPSKMEAFH